MLSLTQAWILSFLVPLDCVYVTQHHPAPQCSAMVTPNAGWDKKWSDVLICRMHSAGSEHSLPVLALPSWLWAPCSGSSWEQVTQTMRATALCALNPHSSSACIAGENRCILQIRTSTLHKDEVVKKKITVTFVNQEAHLKQFSGKMHVKFLKKYKK